MFFFLFTYVSSRSARETKTVESLAIKRRDMNRIHYSRFHDRHRGNVRYRTPGVTSEALTDKLDVEL